MIILINGEFVQADQRVLESLKPGIVVGHGAFETIRVVDGKIEALKRHLIRLRKGLKLLKVPVKFSDEEIEGSIQDVLVKNRLTDARVRVMIWQNKGGNHNHVVAEKLNAPTDQDYEKGFRAIVSKFKRELSPTSAIKSIDYANCRKAFTEANRKGFDEAIMLNSAGEIVEGSRTNIFLIKDNVLLTPHLPSGCLAGVTRQFVFEAAQEIGLKFVEQSLKPQDLKNANEAFVTNSLIGIMPLVQIDQDKVGPGTIGPWTMKLVQTYKQLIQKELKNP